MLMAGGRPMRPNCMIRAVPASQRVRERSILVSLDEGEENATVNYEENPLDANEPSVVEWCGGGRGPYPPTPTGLPGDPSAPRGGTKLPSWRG